MSADTRPGKGPIVDQGGIRGPDGRLVNHLYVNPHGGESPQEAITLFPGPQDAHAEGLDPQDPMPTGGT